MHSASSPVSEQVYMKVCHMQNWPIGSVHWRKSHSTRVESQLKIAWLSQM